MSDFTGLKVRAEWLFFKGNRCLGDEELAIQPRGRALSARIPGGPRRRIQQTTSRSRRSDSRGFMAGPYSMRVRRRMGHAAIPALPSAFHHGRCRAHMSAVNASCTKDLLPERALPPGIGVRIRRRFWPCGCGGDIS